MLVRRSVHPAGPCELPGLGCRLIEIGYSITYIQMGRHRSCAPTGRSGQVTLAACVDNGEEMDQESPSRLADAPQPLAHKSH